MRPSLAVAVIAAASFSSVALADDAKLRYSYPTEPVVYRFVTNSDNEMIGSLFGKGVKGGLHAAAICQFKKVGADGDSSKVELTYKDVKFRQDSPGGKSVYFDTSTPEFKSAKPEDMDAMSKMWRAFIDKPILLTIDPRGQITKVENMKPILEAVRSAGAADPLGEATVETVLKESRMTRMLEELLVTMPAETVKKGSTWSTSSTFIQPPVGSLKQSIAWTVAGEETVEKLAVVHLKGTQTMEVFEDKEKGTRPAGSEVKTDPSESKGTSDLLFDPKTGLVRSSSSSWTVKLSMSFRAENQSLDIQTNLKSAGTATLVAAGAPLDPDNAVTKPDASATQRSNSTNMTPLPGRIIKQDP